MNETYEKQKGITLVALVITIIILLILATISIQSLTNTGLFKRAQEAKDKMENAKKDEQTILGQYIDELNKQTSNEKYEKSKGVNKPELMQGMKAIKFTDPKGNIEATVEQVSDSTKTDWYDYNAKKWANAQTEDGSMWVWIPRYAYKVVYNDTSDKSKGGKFDIVFLIGTTDNYYDENGSLQTAQRQTSENEIIETDSTKTDKYTVHPAFTNESSINYANGGWNQELTGIWVAKFEAGYATSNGNSAPKKESSVFYSQDTVWANESETGGSDGGISARNWIDGIYGSTKTAIKYPTFQGLTYSMNYINYNDAFNISRALTENGNIYGLNKNITDSHLIKNSEWGAVAYLAQSKYGLNEKEIYINNINLNNSMEGKSVYAITGCAGENADAESISVEMNTTIKRPVAKDSTQKIYVWTQENGTKASSTGTIYGIYDMSGGTREITAGLVNNGEQVLTILGESLMNTLIKGKSSQYATTYPVGIKDVGQANWEANTKIGDAIYETSTSGDESTSWYNDDSKIPCAHYPFYIRGGSYIAKSGAGLFCFSRSNGYSAYSVGFRSVLVSI